MSGLEHAWLMALPDPPETKRTVVQFNPSSLRIHRTSHTEGTKDLTKHVVNYVGGSETLSLELHFDTADEGTTDAPVSVSTWTHAIAGYLTPGSGSAGGANEMAPPSVRFHWGDLTFDGVMTSMLEKLDLFAWNGVPLRAMVEISITATKRDSKSDRSASAGSGATAPGGGAFGAAGGVGLGMSAVFGASIGGRLDVPRLTAGGGISGALAIDAGASLSGGFGALGVGVALDGESPAAFAARMGLDPAAWRALAVAGGVELSLTAGAEVVFARGVGTAAGVGAASGGAAASARVTLERLDGPLPRSPRELAATGFALARAGGIDAALQTVRGERAAAAGAAELRAFGMPSGTRGSQPSAPAAAPNAAPRGPLRAAGAAGIASAPAPRPPRADDRATTYGRGVPLRPRQPIGRRP